MDSLRVLACFLVIYCHSNEGYVPGDGVFTMDLGAALILTVNRACVPLFVLISGALLLPMRGSTSDFFKRRFSRVLVPFFIWGVLLALLPIPGHELNWAPGNALRNMVDQGELSLTVYNIVMLPFNFTNSNIHFWFLYVIIGLYMIAPIISPWVEKTNGKGLAAFLSVWFFTLWLPYLSNWPGHPIFPELHGQCDWNTHGMTYYFGGYLGYFILGHALMRMPRISAGKELGLGTVLFLVGWATTHLGFMSTVAARDGYKDLEFFINFLSPNVALMTLGLFLVCRAITLPARVQKCVTRLSLVSFGTFLVHYWVLLWVMHWKQLAPLPEMPAWVSISLIALATMSISSLIAWGLSHLPGKKWLLG